MEFEVKNVKTLGGVLSNNDGTFTQGLMIVVGVKDCPYDDINCVNNVPYKFEGTMTALEIEAGISIFASNWVSVNYPNT